MGGHDTFWQDQPPGRLAELVRETRQRPPRMDSVKGADDLGLPLPSPFDGPVFSVLDYYDDPAYQDCRTLNDKIRARGFRAYADRARPEDFLADQYPDAELVGFADLMGMTTWDSTVPESRNVPLERDLACIEPGDLLGVLPNMDPDSSRDYDFLWDLVAMSPLEPMHDYDILAVGDKLAEAMLQGKTLICQVQSTDCLGEDNASQKAPGFCWRTYTFRVALFLS